MLENVSNQALRIVIGDNARAFKIILPWQRLRFSPGLWWVLTAIVVAFTAMHKNHNVVSQRLH